MTDESLYDRLVERAREARQYALPHISEYRVGAAVRLSDGTVGVGANIENDNFTNTLHAEEVALSDALTNRTSVDTVPEVTHVAVTTTGDDIPDPCGHCKQALTQHASEDMEMVLDAGDEIVVKEFPHQFRL